jgi:hypothetical protein
MAGKSEGPGNQPSPMNLIQGYCEQKKKKKEKKGQLQGHKGKNERGF